MHLGMEVGLLEVCSMFGDFALLWIVMDLGLGMDRVCVWI